MIKIQKGTLAQEVMQSIFSYIHQGHFPPGSKLPPNEELAKQFGVGRSSVREALKELQTLGVVTLKHGEGTYVCSPSSEQSPMEYVAEVRRMIEIYSVSVGIEKANEEDLQELADLYKQMKQHFDDDSRFIYYDRLFHYKLAEITRNPMITSILKSIEILFAQLQSSLIDLEGQKERALNEHKKILDAFLMRDGEKTLQAVYEHHDHILAGWKRLSK
ncbi:FadR/GntR family transcriptional regulator [Ammoniphilus sp. YIM 78166]|uniref:FadR/GntR family transcriptional regulator n=1 Tax=Ammoniphilus sp. YIM 78166 TaxID=1644106 RepID=UPI00106FBD33|nr:FadR/GntR family transcriptional regulator [Ammoniphilus sp. YIM 78166]